MAQQAKTEWLKVYGILPPEWQAEVEINAAALKVGIKDRQRNKPYASFSDDMANETIMALLAFLVEA